MIPQHRFRIGGHIVRLYFKASKENSIALLPSFAHFESEENEQGTPLLNLTIDDAYRPEERGTLIRHFDTGNGITTVRRTSDGGYLFLITDTHGGKCALAQADKDFIHCHCALAGTPSMRTFGLNNVLMLFYAFAGSNHDTALIHASCIVWQEKAYPFIAPSGTGKSTHTALWLSHIEGTQLLNDDNPILRIEDGKPYIYGSPWSGKTPCYRNRRLPLGALTSVQRAKANSVERISPTRALAALLPACSTMKWDTALHHRTLDTLAQTIATTPILALHCLPNQEAATLCHSTILKYSE